ncbi:hypothetical protein [Nocardioides terrisoli]|uniref:hypothetical protein n=1 Tax=Nocardioides terrisoli TaxID=3388267 RepID=UPI00287B77BE|nr:hypothetical protein [Nocardioides marmorisolisilvae]
MSALSRPAGRLPARVYWFRRALVLSVALLLVFGFAHLLGGGGSGGGSGGAQLAGDVHSTSPSPTPTPAGPMAVQTLAAGTSAKKAKKTTSPTPSVPLAAPDGACAADDITVTPSVPHPHAGGPITIDVKLTATRPACTFAVSSKTLAVKITSGSDSIWTSQDCPRAVPKKSVVVRSALPAVVPVTWNGRRSSGNCGPSNAWATPGYYHALAAAIGSEPSDTQFSLSLPPRPVVTKTAHPKPKRTTSTGGSKAGAKSTQSPGSVQGTESSCGGDNAAGTC